MVSATGSIGTCHGSWQCQNVLGERPVWASGVGEVGKVVDSTRPAPTDFTPLNGEDSGLPDEVRPGPARYSNQGGVRAHSTGRGSGLAWRLFWESPALRQPVPREEQRPNWAGQEVSGGLWVGTALRSDPSTRSAAEGRWGASEGHPRMEVRLGRARGSHLVGPNGGRKKASETGKRLIGPPLLQEGDPVL